MRALILIGLVGLFGAVWLYYPKNEIEPRAGQKQVVVGSKNFTESIALAHMIADIIEDQTDFQVVRKVNLGGSTLAWQALLANEIQIYPEYVSTVVLNIYEQPVRSDTPAFEQAEELLAHDNIEYLARLGVNNSYTLVVRRDLAERYTLQAVSDLAAIAPELRCGSDFEFMDRPDGYAALIKAYNLSFNRVKGMDHGIVYRAILDDKLDVAVGYTTDSQIHLLNLVALQDDKQFCGCYDAALLVRKELTERYPEIKRALGMLEGQVSNEEMQRINAKIDYEGLKAKEVVHQFLYEKGLVRSRHG